MVSARSYFARMNENRGESNWLTDDQLLRGTEQFFKLNGYSDLEYNRVLGQGGRTFSSPIVASRKTNMMIRKKWTKLSQALSNPRLRIMI
ncbi:MAG TPA: hypothetical protein VFQ47_03615 [Nitrososphaera sp.]|nr:hypothetical protein [Nitrososphaera sp.]